MLVYCFSFFFGWFFGFLLLRAPATGAASRSHRAPWLAVALRDSEGEEYPAVKEYGSEDRTSWPVSDGIFFSFFFGEKKCNSLEQRLFLEDNVLTQLRSGRCLRFRMGTSRQPRDS